MYNYVHAHIHVHVHNESFVLLQVMDYQPECYEPECSAALIDCDHAYTPLFEASPHSVLQTLVKYFQWFCEHPGISKEALSSMLCMQKSLLPNPNELPSSYDAAMHIIGPHLIRPLSFDICKNDCILFRNQFSDLTRCPKCDSERQMSNSTRRFLYLPLKPRLERLFGSSCMAAILQSHLCSKGTRMFDIHHSPAWHDAYSSGGMYLHNICTLMDNLCLYLHRNF